MAGGNICSVCVCVSVRVCTRVRVHAHACALNSPALSGTGPNGLFNFFSFIFGEYVIVYQKHSRSFPAAGLINAGFVFECNRLPFSTGLCAAKPRGCN